MPIIQVRIRDAQEARTIFDLVESLVPAISGTARILLIEESEPKTQSALLAEIAELHAKIADRTFQLARLSIKPLDDSEVRRTLPEDVTNAVMSSQSK